MTQRFRHSLLETCISTAIGFGVAYAANWWVLPWFGFHPSHKETFVITCIFTVISILRGLAVRRFFNWLHKEGVL